VNLPVLIIFLDEWKQGKPMPSKRGDFAIGILEDKVVCAGGLGMGTCSTLIYN